MERPLRILAIVLSLFVATGFLLFALDDFSRASTASRDRVAGYEQTSPTPAGERVRERHNGRVREAIDDVDDVLLRPFAGLTDDDESRWMQRGVPTLLGLLVYGFMLGYVARFARGYGRAPTGRRLPASRA